MDGVRRVAARGLLLAACLCGAALSPAAEPGGLSPELRRELQYARGLTQLGLPEYAKLVLERIKDPEAGPALKALELEGLLMMGKFEEAKAIIAREPDPQSQGVWAMKLTLADQYYAWGKYPEAREIYGSFFGQYPDGPPESLNDFYRDSAYTYVQMLEYMGEEKAAADAFGLVLKAKLDRDVKRQILTETAELQLRLAEKSADQAERDAWLRRVEELCTGNDGILWVQDLWFGRGIVILAHIKLLNGDVDGAMKLIEEHRDTLTEIDRSLREQAETSGNDQTRLSPMAECRYLLGVMMQDEAERLLAAKGDRGKIVALLAGKEFRVTGKDGAVQSRRRSGALQHLLTVFIQYPTTPWAPDAGMRAQRIEGILKGEFGAKVSYAAAPEQMEKVKKAQFQEAHTVFLQQRFAEAAESYVKVLNLFPDGEAAVAALGELARCYIESADPGDELYTDMVARYLVEGFGRRQAFLVKAGDEVLAVAERYGELKRPDRRQALYEAFFAYVPSHPRAAGLLFQCGQERFESGDFAGAAGFFQRVVDGYPGAPIYAAAASQLAACAGKQGDPGAELKALRSLVDTLAKQDHQAAAALAARLRLASALMEGATNGLASAIEAYDEIIRSVADNPARYEVTPADAQKTRTVLQGALFYRAVCQARLTEPEGRLKEFKQEAIRILNELVDRFPDSTYAPAALGEIGSLWTVLEEPAEAQKALDRLKSQYPDSDATRNALFMLGSSLLKMGRRPAAIAMFRDMFSGSGQYTDTQILVAGTELAAAGENEIALSAFDKVLSQSDKPALVERALLQKGQSLAALGRPADAVKTLEEMLKRYETSQGSVEASMHLSDAYAELGKAEADPVKRVTLFNAAVNAMKRVRKYDRTPAGSARSTLGVGRIYRRMAEAEAAHGTKAQLDQARNDAIVAYQSLILFGNETDAVVRPYLEEAGAECMPLLLDAGRWQDAVDNGDLYIEQFPAGGHLVDVRKWRNAARMHLVGAGAPQAGEEPAAPPPAEGTSP